MCAGLWLAALLAAIAHGGVMAATAADDAGGQSRYFAIEVVDDQTGRGVPLIELSTVSHVSYWTDSAGMVAIDDPALVNRKVFFNIAGHGYEYPADGFGIRGMALEVKPGETAQIKVKRRNIAERLYRVTGEGIYEDSVQLGRKVPIKQPLLNGQVTGQDSSQSAVYGGKIYWFWGDTSRQSYPLGHFGTAGATSELPGKGGLEPSLGIDLTYFVDSEGFSRPMLPKPEEGNVMSWFDAVMILPGPTGAERMVGRSSQMTSLDECVGESLVVFNDEKKVFETLARLPIRAPLRPHGNAFRVSVDGVDYFYFPDPFPNMRVKADWQSIQKLGDYEGFTCLKAGSKYDPMTDSNAPLDRAADGKLVWAWKKGTPSLSSEQLEKLVQSGKLKPDEAWFCPLDVETKKPIRLADASVRYNDYRRRWVMIAGEVGGSSSFLGEIWYLEADKPEGPWAAARKVVTHDRYSLYNPKHHAFFDEQGGRIIYFDGTYATTFSRDGEATPRYDYNQMMYRLDLADPRLKLQQ